MDCFIPRESYRKLMVVECQKNIVLIGGVLLNYGIRSFVMCYILSACELH